MADFYSELEMLLNPASRNDMGGGPGSARDAAALANLIMGGGSASLEGQQLFGQPITSGNLGPGQLREPGELQPMQLAPITPSAPAKKPLPGNLQSVLESADQIASSLGSVHGSGKPVESGTLLSNPFGPGSYDPNNPEQVARIQEQGKRATELDRGRNLLEMVAASTDPAIRAGSKDLVQGILEQMGVKKTKAQETFEEAKARAAGTQAGQGTDASVDDISRLVAEYKMPLPSGFALRSPYWQQVLAQAAKLNPSFDATQYKARQAARTDFATGRAARNITGLNTAVDHLKNYADAGEALENSSVQLWNLIRNKGLAAVGDPRVVAFRDAATAVESELAAIFKGAGATDQEIKQWRANFKEVQSPEQIKSTVKASVKLMKGRLDALDDIWRQTMGTKRDVPIFSDKSLQILDELGLSKEIKDPVATRKVSIPQGAQIETGKTYKGKPVYRLPSGELWVE